MRASSSEAVWGDLDNADFCWNSSLYRWWWSYLSRSLSSSGWYWWRWLWSCWWGDDLALWVSLGPLPMLLLRMNMNITISFCKIFTYSIAIVQRCELFHEIEWVWKNTLIQYNTGNFCLSLPLFLSSSIVSFLYMPFLPSAHSNTPGPIFGACKLE